MDHDPPAKRKGTPGGILMRASGVLTVIFGWQETSDVWVEGLKWGWGQGKGQRGWICRLVIYRDHGPNNGGPRTQFLQRRVECADGSAREVRRVCYPPYPSPYNSLERCWSIWEPRWGGALLNCLKVILPAALRMTGKGPPPTVKRLAGGYQKGLRLSKKALKRYEARWERSQTLHQYDIPIKPNGR